MDRTQKIRDKIQIALGVTDKITADYPIPNTLIYETITSISRELAEELLCIERSTSLTIVSDGTGSATSSVPAGFYRLKNMVFPDNYLTVAKELSTSDWWWWRRRITTLAGFNVVYFTLWNNYFRFYPVPTSVLIDYYLSPDNSLVVGEKTVVTDGFNNPETPEICDTALYYGAVAQLALMQKRADLAGIWMALYQKELERLRNAFPRTKSLKAEIKFWDV